MTKRPLSAPALRGSTQRHVGVLLLAGAILLVVSPLAAWAAEGEAASNLPKVVNFTILATILALALRKPLANYLNARAAAIRDQLAQARADREEAGKAAEAAAHRKEILETEVEAVRRRIAQSARDEGERIVAAAEVQARKITENAETQLTAALEAAERRLAAGAARATVRLARARLETGMSEEDHKRLLDTGIAAIRSR